MELPACLMFLSFFLFINEGLDELLSAQCHSVCVRIIKACMMLMRGNDTDSNCYGD